MALGKGLTHDLPLTENEDTKMVVAPATGNVVVFGTEDGSKAAFHVYESNGEWKKQQRIVKSKHH